MPTKSKLILPDDQAAELSIIVDKFALLDAKLNGELVERSDEIYLAQLALVAGVPFFMIGEPGTAKTVLPARVFSYIEGARYFDTLLTRLTQMEEVFGPLSLAELMNDRFVRHIVGYLADADGAMLDEIFKAGRSILNALLWIINERKYRHGDKVITAPLQVLYCASNELPEEDGLAALYDRLTIRKEVSKIRSPDNFQKMLSTHFDPDPPKILTWDECKLAHQSAMAMPIPAKIDEVLTELRRNLKAQEIEPSDRRFRQLRQVVQAAALLDGASEVDTEHVTPAEHVLWQIPEQFSTVSKVVSELADPIDTEIQQLMVDVEKLNDQIVSLKSFDEKQRLGDEINGKLKKAQEDLRQLKPRVGESVRKQTRLEEAGTQVREVAYKVLVDIYSFPPEKARRVARRQEEAQD